MQETSTKMTLQNYAHPAEKRSGCLTSKHKTISTNHGACCYYVTRYFHDNSEKMMTTITTALLSAIIISTIGRLSEFSEEVSVGFIELHMLLKLDLSNLNERSR